MQGFDISPEYAELNINNTDWNLRDHLAMDIKDMLYFMGGGSRMYEDMYDFCVVKKSLHMQDLIVLLGYVCLNNSTDQNFSVSALHGGGSRMHGFCMDLRSHCVSLKTGSVLELRS